MLRTSNLNFVEFHGWVGWGGVGGPNHYLDTPTRFEVELGWVNYNKVLFTMSTPIAQCCSFWFRTIDFTIQFSKLIILPLYHSIHMGLSINNLWGKVGFSEKLIFAKDEGVKEKLLISQ